MTEITREFELIVEGLLSKHVSPIREMVAGNSRVVEIMSQHLAKVNGDMAKLWAKADATEQRLIEVDARGTQGIRDTVGEVVRTALIEHSAECPLIVRVGDLDTWKVSQIAAKRAANTWVEWLKPAIYVVAGAAALQLLLHGPDIVKVISR